MPTSLRGLPPGTAIDVINLKRDIDNGNYTFNIKKNYQLVVPESELKPLYIWMGDNVYVYMVLEYYGILILLCQYRQMMVITRVLKVLLTKDLIS